ncbi:PDDEXK nuclease domain-containing protein [uncultured Duncaniella sp.]|uniref:PDDEXK nuclease domain-containing protein n=2 Tax=uncultured Duncaniella sp. TaxID=2768039 RepID=UPI00260ACD23|nr:PDDEXK nuclease domain-containing protein [uncultured Duncaniella sp.]
MEIIKDRHIDNTMLSEIRQLIESTRSKVAMAVNSAMTMMYWHIGDRINRELLGGGRAAYGKQIVASLSRELTEQYGGREFSERNLWRMMQFSSKFPDLQIVTPLVSQLSWSHFLQVMPIEDDLARNFYLTMAADQRWSKRTLKAKIDGMLYERTAIAKQPEEVVLRDLAELRDERKLSPDLVFQDPYFLDFLGLNGNYSEKDLESAIVADLEHFLTEFGNDFAFMARQKRITVDNEDYYIDLLFYHRRLRCLVAIDLKLGKFQAAYKGQMELYLRWLEKFDMVEGENKPIGLILCAGKNEEHVELMHLRDSNIRVADYLTKLPDRKLIEQKLQQAIERAHNHLSNQSK